MLYKIYYLLQAERIQVIDSKVKIDGADYNTHFIFPYVERDKKQN